ncbi:MAG: DUF6378 domain-containing protein [Paracoccaceae bacterium]|nr:DUF6378 domain-containing protein [Paracoccaceae bacterium]
MSRAREIRSAVLDCAREAVLKDRAATHGAPEDTFGMLAALWSVRLNMMITPAQVAIMLIDLKTARAWENPGHDDNWVDMAGYAACGASLADADRQVKPHDGVSVAVLMEGDA